MMRFRRGFAWIVLVGLTALAAACSDSSFSPQGSAKLCELGVVETLASCVVMASEALRSCFLSTGEPCAADDPGVRAAFDYVPEHLAGFCSNDATLLAAGYPPLFTIPTLVGRLQESCRAESAALAARTFGGPQGAAFQAADAAGRACLDSAHQNGASLISFGLATRGDCIAERAGPCDVGIIDRFIADEQQMAVDAIAAACPALQDLVAVDPQQYVARADLQSQCATATALPDTGPFSLACGPREAIAELPRGEWRQVVLDESIFGTRCGDGSPYAFQVRLAPEGSPVENVVVGMEGGGVCVFEEDCASRPADLFEALSDPPFELGPLSNDPAFSPFADWTKVFLPYCTQDVFIGGGATSNFPSVTVHRFGSIDVRAALQYVRDAIWRVLDAESPEGYRPDRMRVLFGGFSAGGFGTLYNYHYVLDDLQWAHTAAYPDQWAGTISGPDAYNAPESARPGQASTLAGDVAGMQSFPVNNLHAHAQPVLTYLRLLGVEPEPDGSLRVGGRGGTAVRAGAGAPAFESPVLTLDGDGHGRLRAAGAVRLVTAHGPVEGAAGWVTW